MPSLSRSASKNDRWLPTGIDQLDRFLANLIQNTGSFKHAYELRRNLAYNIQWLQYLDFSMRDLRLTSVIWTMNVKNFVVVGSGVVEAILYYVIRAKGLQRETKWRTVAGPIRSNEFKTDGKPYRLESTLFEFTADPIEIEMTFDALLKKVESKKLLGDDHALYAQLKYLRKLRNRVHLHLVERELDTDWNNFNAKELTLMKESLHALLTSDMFSPDKQQLGHLEFLQEGVSVPA